MALCGAGSAGAQDQQEATGRDQLIALPNLTGTYTWQRTQEFRSPTPREHLDADQAARLAMQHAGSAAARIENFLPRLNETTQWTWHESLTAVGRCVAKLALATSADEQSLTEFVYDEDRRINRWQLCYHDQETLLVRRGCDRRSDIVSISSFSAATNLTGDLDVIFDKLLEVNAMMVNGKRTDADGRVAWVYRHGDPMVPRGPAHKVRLAPFFLEVGDRMVMTRTARDDSVVFDMSHYAIGGSPLLTLRVHMRAGFFHESSEEYYLPFSPVVRLTESSTLEHDPQAHIVRPPELVSALDGPPDVGMDYREDGSPRRFDPRRGLPDDLRDAGAGAASVQPGSPEERAAVTRGGRPWLWTVAAGGLGLVILTGRLRRRRRTA
jgi:hypothetical protein